GKRYAGLPALYPRAFGPIDPGEAFDANGGLVLTHAGRRQCDPCDVSPVARLLSSGISQNASQLPHESMVAPFGGPAAWQARSGAARGEQRGNGELSERLLERLERIVFACGPGRVVEVIAEERLGPLGRGAVHPVQRERDARTQIQWKRGH